MLLHGFWSTEGMENHENPVFFHTENGALGAQGSIFGALVCFLQGFTNLCFFDRPRWGQKSRTWILGVARGRKQASGFLRTPPPPGSSSPKSQNQGGQWGVPDRLSQPVDPGGVGGFNAMRLQYLFDSGQAPCKSNRAHARFARWTPHS